MVGSLIRCHMVRKLVCLAVLFIPAALHAQSVQIAQGDHMGSGSVIFRYTNYPKQQPPQQGPSSQPKKRGSSSVRVYVGSDDELTRAQSDEPDQPQPASPQQSAPRPPGVPFGGQPAAPPG